MNRRRTAGVRCVSEPTDLPDAEADMTVKRTTMGIYRGLPCSGLR